MGKLLDTLRRRAGGPSVKASCAREPSQGETPADDPAASRESAPLQTSTDGEPIPFIEIPETGSIRRDEPDSPPAGPRPPFAAAPMPSAFTMIVGFGM